MTTPASSATPPAVATTGHYVIVVKEARNLKAADANGSSDPYVIVKFNGDRFRTKVLIIFSFLFQKYI